MYKSSHLVYSHLITSEFLQPDTSNEACFWQAFFHLSEASSLFLIHGVISGRSAGSDSVRFAWRRWRWQWSTAVALVMTGMSILQSYRHTWVILKIPQPWLQPERSQPSAWLHPGRCGHPQYPRTLWCQSPCVLEGHGSRGMLVLGEAHVV